MTKQATLRAVQRNRIWVKQLDLPPSTITKLKWQQARSATVAGAHAWRNGSSTLVPAADMPG